MDLLVTPVVMVLLVSLLVTFGVFLVYLMSASNLLHGVKFVALSGLYLLAILYFIKIDQPFLVSVVALVYVKSVGFLLKKAKGRLG